jgi:adenosine/AMP kinase
MTEMAFQLKLVQIDNPDQLNFILGQSHFIKTVEDIHEAVVTGIPGAKFGLAFCEASGKALVRSSGTDDTLQALAEHNAFALGAGHTFILFLRDAYPVNVLNAIKLIPEVASIFCATANPVQVILAETEQGRGVLGVVDGLHTQGIEDADGVAWRKGFLRMIGYKA